MPEIFYDPSNPDAPEFSSEEMDSLQVGEQLEQAEQQMLAGKYANAEELERAYLSLQQKLGERGEPTEDDASEAEYDEGEEYYDDSEYTDTDLLTELREEWDRGELSEETLNLLAEEMDVDDLIKLGMDMTESNTDADLDGEQVAAIKNFAGGDESYSNLMSWAQQNLAEQYIDAFDSVVDSANPAAIQLAVAGLMATYQENMGYEGRMLSGSDPNNDGSIKPFRSQAQVVEAMQDPRYDNDPAYRQDVMQRLEISNTFIS